MKYKKSVKLKDELSYRRKCAELGFVFFWLGGGGGGGGTAESDWSN